MRFETRPLPAVWPTGQRTLIDNRKQDNFRAPWAATMQLLTYELVCLRAREPVIIEAGYLSHEIRHDGKPRANARPSDPAVVISFESQYGPLRYGCDTYWRHEANIRAIALALEALRKVDRFGVSGHGEQYTGWLALPSESMTAVEARELLERYGGAKAALLATHPDTAGEDKRAEFQLVQRARKVLGL